MNTLPLLRSLFSLLLLAAAPLAQDSAPAEKALRLHVIGASVSGGFEDGPLTGAKEQGDSVTLQHVLKAWCGEHARASTHGTLQMQMMFTDPLGIGEQQIKGLERKRADLVVGIDFPFWFAYGYMSGDEAQARSARLAQGLTMLEQFEGPMLIGDLPDMQGAERRMLNPKQIPDAEQLVKLNAELRQWAERHPNVRLLPLSQLVRTMKHDGARLQLKDGLLQTKPGALLQGDKLHATRLGMAYLGYSMQAELRALFPVGHALRDQEWTLEQFIEATGAEGELEVVRAATAAKVVESGSKQ